MALMEEVEASRGLVSKAHATTAAGLRSLVAMGRGDAQFEAGKILFHADRLYDWLNRRSVAPVTLELDITLSCNDRCPRCVHGFALQERHLALSSIEHILADAVALQIRGVTLTGGGDPLRHPDFSKVMGLVRSMPIRAGIFTNGGLIADFSKAEEMVQSFHWIRVSLDSASESTFRRVRGSKGLSERLACIARLPEARKISGSSCELGVSFLTSHMVAADIAEAARMVRSLGFDYIQFKPMIDWVKGAHHLSTSFDQKDVFQAIEEAASLENAEFKVLCSTKKYCADILQQRRPYSEFHSAWFVLAVAPSLTSSSSLPALYLDCSSKYLDRWKIGEFESLEEIVLSKHRREFIQCTSSQLYCVPPEKHAAYNHLLEGLWARQQVAPWGLGELLQLSPSTVKHECWL